VAQSRKSAARRKSPGQSAPGTADAGSETEAGLSFEGALAQLEETVGRREAGEMPLEEALTLFEQGVRLSRRCTTTLAAAERRIEMLVADRDDDATEPFGMDAPEEDGPEDLEDLEEDEEDEPGD
jgi:exodeoxyribonuclease VII small subunit